MFFFLIIHCFRIKVMNFRGAAFGKFLLHFVSYSGFRVILLIEFSNSGKKNFHQELIENKRIQLAENNKEHENFLIFKLKW